MPVSGPVNPGIGELQGMGVPGMQVPENGLAASTDHPQLTESKLLHVMDHPRLMKLPQSRHPVHLSQSITLTW